MYHLKWTVTKQNINETLMNYMVLEILSSVFRVIFCQIEFF